MYAVNLTGSFTGAFPSNISVFSRSHTAAVAHYKKVFRAKQIQNGSTGSKAVLESAYGFRFRVDTSRTQSSSTVRLALPPKANREAIALALAGSRYQIRKQRTGIVVVDPFRVTWTLV